jgi:K+-sensing histidine kinase KdpD
VILAAWFGGLWPGVLATALSLVLGDYLFIAPRGKLLHYEDLLTWNRVSYLFFFGLVISIMAEGFRGRALDSEGSYLAERSQLCKLPG